MLYFWKPNHVELSGRNVNGYFTTRTGFKHGFQRKYKWQEDENSRVHSRRIVLFRGVGIIYLAHFKLIYMEISTNWNDYMYIDETFSTIMHKRFVHLSTLSMHEVTT